MNPTDLSTLMNPDLVWVMVTSMMRSAVALSLIPLFSPQRVPVAALAALTLAVSLPVGLHRMALPLPDPGAWPMFSLLLKEAAIGSVIGLGFGAFCGGLQTAGEIIDHQTGLTFTQNIDPLHGNNVAVTAIALEHILFAALVGSGFILAIVDTLYASYQAWPMGTVVPRLGDFIPVTIAQGSGALLSLALLLAGPVVLVLFIVDVGMSLLNRAAPTFGIFNLTLSMKSLVGLLVLVAALPMVMTRSLIAAKEVAVLLRQLIVGAT